MEGRTFIEVLTKQSQQIIIISPFLLLHLLNCFLIYFPLSIQGSNGKNFSFALYFPSAFVLNCWWVWIIFWCCRFYPMNIWADESEHNFNGIPLKCLFKMPICLVQKLINKLLVTWACLLKWVFFLFLLLKSSLLTCIKVVINSLIVIVFGISSDKMLKLISRVVFHSGLNFVSFKKWSHHNQQHSHNRLRQYPQS